MRRNESWSGGSGAWSLLVHGGAGDLAEERRERHVDGCRAAVRAGADVLGHGGSALDAVECAVRVLEDDPVFNAGTGACLTADATLELDACIMDGENLRAGAVCALPPFKNPIRIARAVLEDGVHVLYAGSGAAAFAERLGFSPATADSMITDASRDKLRRALDSGQIASWPGGTVGAVARDRKGRLAAATSTGGMVGKRVGRVGDTPLPGAGTYADDRAGAASATGHGEGIVRVSLTASIVAALGAGTAPERAATTAVERMFERVGSSGGVIVVAPDGRLALARTTGTMTWAAKWDGGAEAGS